VVVAGGRPEHNLLWASQKRSWNHQEKYSIGKAWKILKGDREQKTTTKEKRDRPSPRALIYNSDENIDE